MPVYHFEKLLQKKGWIGPGWIETEPSGRILSIRLEKSVPESDRPAKVDDWFSGYLVPGISNGHSHAFQYAMAGAAEGLPSHHARTEGAPGAGTKGASQAASAGMSASMNAGMNRAASNGPSGKSRGMPDTFWTWRDEMYRLANTMGPEEVEKVATTLYREMKLNGYTHVVEFHYIHRDPTGEYYSARIELSEAIARAAKAARIGLTLVPVFYRQGGFKKAALPEQRRFLFRDVEDYLSFLDDLAVPARQWGCQLGFGVHSLRAAAAEDVIEIFKQTREGPRHLHISEQMGEVEACISAYGKRPIEWLSQNVRLDRRFHLVHATHASPDEVEILARAEANVVLCPSTEGNLGDGFFPIGEYFGLGGRFCIGSDSQIGLNPFEDMRWLDYGARLRTHHRGTFCQRGYTESSAGLFETIIFSGRAACGIESEDFFEPHLTFDAIELRKDQPLLALLPSDKVLSALIYSGDRSWIKRVVQAGR